MGTFFGFGGRIGRGAWWLGQLFIIIILIVGVIVAFQLKGIPADMEDFYDSEAFEFLTYTFLPLAVWINFATSVQRFHDRGKSGIHALVIFLPTVGSIYQIVTCGILAGDMGSNAYGSAPGYGKKKRKAKPPRVSTAAVAGSAIPDFSNSGAAANASPSADWSFENNRNIETGRVRPEPAAPVPVTATPAAAPSRGFGKAGLGQSSGGFGQRGFGQRTA